MEKSTVIILYYYYSATDIYYQCQLTGRRILKTPLNTDIQHLYTTTCSLRNIITDEIIEKVSVRITDKYKLQNETKKNLAKQNREPSFKYLQ